MKRARSRVWKTISADLSRFEFVGQPVPSERDVVYEVMTDVDLAHYGDLRDFAMELEVAQRLCRARRPD